MLYSFGERSVSCESESWFVADNAAVIGSVVLGHDSSVWFSATVRGDNDVITIGAGSNVQDNAVLHTDEGKPLTIGRGSTIGHMAMLHGCTVGDNTLIGIKAVILDHAVIGHNCIIGANTLITPGKRIPDNSLVMGAPGKIVREVSTDQVNELHQIAQHYVERFHRFHAELQVQPRPRLLAS